MRRRLFVAINLPFEVRARLAGVTEPLAPLFPEARWTRPEDMHITISFLGYQEDAAIPTIMDALRAAAGEASPPEIAFIKIIGGPPGNTPRMLWLVGDEKTDRRLAVLKAAVERELGERGICFDRPASYRRGKEEFRKFHTHVTLVRFNTNDVESKIHRVPISIDCGVQFVAEAFYLMESTLKRTGAEYTRLQAFAFEK